MLTVLTFSTVEEAITLANSTDYGLVAGIWSQNIDTAHYVASRVQAGQVFVNNYGAAGGIQMPFGGYKKRNWSREGLCCTAKLYANEKYRYTLCTT